MAAGVCAVIGTLCLIVGFFNVSLHDDITSQRAPAPRPVINAVQGCADGYAVVMQSENGYVCWRVK